MENKSVNSILELVNEKNLGGIPVNRKRKEEAIKTVFNLSATCNSLIRAYADASDLSIREFLSDLAETAKQASEDGSLAVAQSNKHEVGEKLLKIPTARVGYTISAFAKKIFEDLSKKNGISRDKMVESAILTYHIKQIECSLTTREKIDLAKEIQEKADKILDLYSEISQKVNILSVSGDIDFPAIDYSEMLYYIEYGIIDGTVDGDSFYSIVQDFITKKEEDLKNGIEGFNNLESYIKELEKGNVAKMTDAELATIEETEKS